MGILARRACACDACSIQHNRSDTMLCLPASSQGAPMSEPCLTAVLRQKQCWRACRALQPRTTVCKGICSSLKPLSQTDAAVFSGCSRSKLQCGLHRCTKLILTFRHSSEPLNLKTLLSSGKETSSASAIACTPHLPTRRFARE